MGNDRQIADYSKVLAVEGYSDLAFYIEVLEHLSKDSEVFIQRFNGAQDLMLQLDVLITPELLAEKEAIGVILDADNNPAARRQSLQSKLLALTGVSLDHGQWSPGPPRLGFFVAPDGSNTGEVETIAWNSWANDPVNATARGCIEGYLTCMAGAGHSPQSPDKAKVSTLLAVLYDDDPRLGPAARAGMFSFDRPEFAAIVDFLRGL